jgi:glutathione S-transferase/3-isopropylmalate dehydratase
MLQNWIAGEAFTAVDISVTYALNLGQRNCGITLDDAEQAYLARTMGRDAYKRAMERSHEGVNT